MNLGSAALQQRLLITWKSLSLKQCPRPSVKDEKITNPKWLGGFSSGEACFFINISKSSSNLIGFQVFLLFALTQHTRKLLENIKELRRS